MARSLLLSVFLVAILSSHRLVHSQDRDRQIAATVEGNAIYVHEVEREVAKVTKNQEVAAGALKLLKAQALRQLVKRRLILLYLERKKLSASKEELALAIARVKEQLKSQNLTLEAYLKSAGLTHDEFSRVFSWQLGWQQYLDRYVTEENLESYFNRNRREFDGTQIRVAHILLKVDRSAAGKAWDDAVGRAAKIRGQVVDGKVSFADAARQHSQTPAAAKGGDIGFISRHEPMPESFSQAAFALKKNEISQPVKSSFGVHLIQCTEIKPGQKTWQDVRVELKREVTRYLFDWVAEQQLKAEKVQLNFTGNSPYFRPGTDEVVEGNQ